MTDINETAKGWIDVGREIVDRCMTTEKVQLDRKDHIHDYYSERTKQTMKGGDKAYKEARRNNKRSGKYVKKGIQELDRRIADGSWENTKKYYIKKYIIVRN